MPSKTSENVRHKLEIEFISINSQQRRISSLFGYNNSPVAFFPQALYSNSTRMTENNNINNIKPHKCNLCVNKVNCIAWRKENKLWRRREKNLGHRKTTRVQPISMKVYGVQLYLQLTVQNLIQKPPIMQKRSSWTETLTDRHEKTQE